MQGIYDLNIIPEILKMFKVNEVIISGITDDTLIKNIFKYDAIFTQINTDSEDCIKENPLNILSSFKNYDAIFLDDDSNWYTVFNELENIKKSNADFPLVFICNNNFPNKRRDSYSNPDKIPSEFRQSYTNGLPVNYNDMNITINDGFYHACEENTPKNGVLTAIEDFLNENSHIGIMNLYFIKEITILYLKIPVNQKRISIISKKIKNEMMHDINISDKLVENQLLISYINEYNIYNEDLNNLEVEISKKDEIIYDYGNIIRNQNNEMDLKETQLNVSKSKLSLKDSQIKNIESKLVNKENKINYLKNQLQIVNGELDSMTSELDKKDDRINSLNDELDSMTSELDKKDARINSLNDELDSMTSELDKKDARINSLNDEFNEKESMYNNHIKFLNFEVNKIENKYNDVLVQKENEFAKKEDELNNLISTKNKIINQRVLDLKYNENLIVDKTNQINSLNRVLVQKENEFAKKEDELNNWINNKNEIINQKESQLKTKQQELIEKENEVKSLQYNYTKQLSKLDNNEYCISCYKEEISNNHLEIEYLQNNNFIKRILSPFAYLYLILNSNFKEFSLNIKLYKALKNSKCFDIGYYLNKNKDLCGSNWCKYFSPELHYVCKGFNENRSFNKKFFDRNSKRELLEYLLTCDK